MTERQLQDAVIDAAEQLGFRTYHTYDSRRSTPGYPDLHVVGHGTQFFFEFKRHRGVVSIDQDAWIAELQRSGIVAMVVRPDDYDEVLALLREAAGQENV